VPCCLLPAAPPPPPTPSPRPPPCPTLPLHPPQGELGEKKRQKTLAALKECDVALVVVDVARHAAAPGGAALDLGWEQRLLAAAAKYGAAPLLLYNLRGAGLKAAAGALARLQAGLDPEGEVGGPLGRPMCRLQAAGSRGSGRPALASSSCGEERGTLGLWQGLGAARCGAASAARCLPAEPLLLGCGASWAVGSSSGAAGSGAGGWCDLVDLGAQRTPHLPSPHLGAGGQPRAGPARRHAGRTGCGGVVSAAWRGGQPRPRAGGPLFCVWLQGPESVYLVPSKGCLLQWPWA
jgi:hypothetical protein